MKNFFKDFRHDLPASIVVFFVAVPLCLGVALASGAPLFAGLIAGIVGGIIVGASSGSALGVSGPAAGLAVIVLTAIAKLGGSWEMFLMAVVLAGVFQVILGFAKAGVIANFFPSSVIQGMLTGIGLLIILKQLPHALGWDKDAFGEEDFFQPDGETTFSEILKAFEFFSVEAIIISGISLVILVLWDTILSKKHKIFSLINGPLIVVLFGIVLNYCFQNNIVGGTLSPEHLVTVPVPSSFSDFLSQFTLPDFSGITNSKVWEIALVLALVASLETLLCVEATDKLDINKRVTPTNRELKAQGLGNIISGLIGGLPITQVIVRSSANISFGGKTKLSAISHGFLILLSALTMASVLNMIPLASLATILLLVGYKLAKPAFFKELYKLGWEQFIPFITTVIVIILTDLLIAENDTVFLTSISGTKAKLCEAFSKSACIFILIFGSYGIGPILSSLCRNMLFLELSSKILLEILPFIGKCKIVFSIFVIKKDFFGIEMICCSSTFSSFPCVDNVIILSFSIFCLFNNSFKEVP